MIYRFVGWTSNVKQYSKWKWKCNKRWNFFLSLAYIDFFNEIRFAIATPPTKIATKNNRPAKIFLCLAYYRLIHFCLSWFWQWMFLFAIELCVAMRSNVSYSWKIRFLPHICIILFTCHNIYLGIIKPLNVCIARKPQWRSSSTVSISNFPQFTTYRYDWIAATATSISFSFSCVRTFFAHNKRTIEEK